MSEPVAKSLGIVIRTADFRDYDRVADILTPEGKKTVTVKGVRKQTAKMVGAAQPFTYGEFVLYKKADKYTVTGYLHMDSFQTLSENILKYACGSVILDILDAFSFDPDESRQIFLLTLRTLHSIAYGDIPALDALCFYIIQFISVTGFEPNITECVRCGESMDIEQSDKFFSPGDGGLVCPGCTNTEDHKICKGAVVDMLRTSKWNAEDMKLIRYSKVVLSDLMRVLLPYIELRSEKRLKSTEFLRSLNIFA